jgi:CDP-6-deoxy-D-xylo-4-hexulose-3-dehydrase
VGREQGQKVTVNYNLASTTWDSQEVEVARALLEKNQLTMGQEVKKFEEEFAAYSGTKFAVMFNSGSSANLGMLAALKFMKNSPVVDGDEVIVPTVSWSTTYYPVNQVGLVLKFVDINLNSLNIDLSLVKAAIGPKTKAILAVNLLGNPAELRALRELALLHNLILLEDNCESLGAEIDGEKAGTFGLAGTYSFFFSHHICTMEGGMVTTNDKIFAETLISLRAHGWTRGLEKENSVFSKSDDDWEDLFRFVLPGYNLRPLELSGAIGRVQLQKFPDFLSWRRSNAKVFIELFSGRDDVIVQTENGNSSWFGFSLVLNGKLSEKRKELLATFSNHGIETRPIVAGNFTINPVMKHLEYAELQEFPIAERIHKDGFFIGNHHLDFRDKIKMVYEVFDDFAKENK